MLTAQFYTDALHQIFARDARVSICQFLFREIQRRNWRNRDWLRTRTDERELHKALFAELGMPAEVIAHLESFEEHADCPL